MLKIYLVLLGNYLVIMKSYVFLAYTLFLKVDWGQLASFINVLEHIGLYVLIKQFFNKKE